MGGSAIITRSTALEFPFHLDPHIAQSPNRPTAQTSALCRLKDVPGLQGG